MEAIMTKTTPVVKRPVSPAAIYQLTPFNVQHTTFNVQHATFNVQHNERIAIINAEQL
jgi:hypothetical protein